MKWTISGLIIVQLLVACSGGRADSTLNDRLSHIAGWNVEIKEGTVDTVGVGNWLPQPETEFIFTNSMDSACMKPRIDLYPIAIKDYIEEKLGKSMMLRSSLYPPAPKTYTTDKYFVLGWNLAAYDDHECCECKELEDSLIKELQLEDRKGLE